MANKVGLVLSLVVFLHGFLICLDVLNLQSVTSRLTIETNYLNTLINRQKMIDEEVYIYVDTVIKGQLTCLTSCNPGAGQQLQYRISKEYQTVYRRERKTIAITRSVLISELA